MLMQLIEDTSQSLQAELQAEIKGLSDGMERVEAATRRHSAMITGVQPR
jgi:hypothetical protein